MKKNLLFALCCVLPVFFLGTAFSADGPYLSANIGAAMLSDSDFSGSRFPGTAELGYDPGWAFGAAFGYGFTNFRFEGEVSHQENDIDETSARGFTLDSDGTVTGEALLLNGYYDFTNQTAFTPYISAGFGYAIVEIEDYNIAGSGVGDYSDDDSVFAYQLGFGVGYGVNENVTIDFKYRYFATSDPEFETSEGEFQSHNILLGIRYNF